MFIKKPSVPQLAVQGCACGSDWQGLYNATTHKEFCSCVNNFQQCCLLFLYNNILSVVNHII